MLDYDSELRHHHEALLRSLDVQSHDRILDIGCGAGQTTRAVARIATRGSVIGIDTAESALQTARHLTVTSGLRNVEYVCGDAASPLLLRASFNLAISRFGTMFFADPAAAFTNIHNSLRAHGRLVMIVWQTALQNEWAVAIHRALVGDETALPGPQSSRSAFSLGEAHIVRTILDAASFTNVDLKEVHAPVYYGPDVARALEFVSGFANVMNAMNSQTDIERERTVSRLRDTMTRHHTVDGVQFESRAWIVTAERGTR